MVDIKHKWDVWNKVWDTVMKLIEKGGCDGF